MSRLSRQVAPPTSHVGSCVGQGNYQFIHVVALNPVPQEPKDRFEVYRYFDGISEESREVRANVRGRVPMVKTFLLEHVSAYGNRPQKSVELIFSMLRCELHRVDESFWVVRAPVVHLAGGSPAMDVVGYLETYDARFFAFYTVERADVARKRVHQWITHSPDLDSTWFSSQLLQVLWNKDVQHRGDSRFGKLVFKYDSIFEMPDDTVEADDDDELTDEEMEDSERSEDQVETERRSARFEMGDRIGRIRKSLKVLQDEYDPLHALYSLRFPSQTGIGCHDLYQHGQITNRAGGFLDHRNTVRYFYQVYNTVLNETEGVAWASNEQKSSSGPSMRLKGVPLMVRFSEPLNEATFNRWVSLAFQKRNRFRLWGEPIRLGPTKVHAYGADRHLWQPINLEMTERGLTAILPQGTCGNTFHRLVTNIQRFVSPKVEAWVGSRRFVDLLTSMPAPESIR